MPLEDDFCDIIKKARMGQGLAVGELAQKTGLPETDIAALERGSRTPVRKEVEALAAGLGLKPAALAAIVLDGWEPEGTPAGVSVETVMGDIGGYAVKGYVVHDSGEALFVDTAYNPTAMLEILQRLGLRLTGICLTHGHADHAEGLHVILDRWPVPVYLGRADEPLLSWRPSKERLTSPEDGRTIPVGRCTVRCLATPGHTPGGTCYRVEQGPHDICFVGDTLFAGSIGRANPFSLYPVHLESVRRRLLTLPPRTILFPGHGPATTVAEEVAHNPFGSAA
ncbi:MAG: MBL fold metallo-hydrolase [Nitrospirae bacterium]|nr:MAG: MBL fold metallo-hydrolase [Nitrospirota bacterium]